MRQPTEVFTLLETLYYEFDKSAKKSKVFKVETVRFNCSFDLPIQCAAVELTLILN